MNNNNNNISSIGYVLTNVLLVPHCTVPAFGQT